MHRLSGINTRPEEHRSQYLIHGHLQRTKVSDLESKEMNFPVLVRIHVKITSLIERVFDSTA